MCVYVYMCICVSVYFYKTLFRLDYQLSTENVFIYIHIIGYILYIFVYWLDVSVMAGVLVLAGLNWSSCSPSLTTSAQTPNETSKPDWLD